MTIFVTFDPAFGRKWLKRPCRARMVPRMPLNEWYEIEADG
jgi:hypothetical protein